MERLEPYKGFQIRAYQEWSGQWLAEARKAAINRPDADYIATPSDHPTPEAAMDFIKQMIDQQMINEDSLARLRKRGDPHL
jgi:pyridoxine/pyridoxamine 5'-phosphate oxidase